MSDEENKQEAGVVDSEKFASAEPLTLLSIVIPARDEEGCVASTVKHLHVELDLRGVPHEIVVVDDGSSDDTWKILQAEREKIPQLKPVQNPGPHGFGRAIHYGLDHSSGDAVTIMMADESDDCRDVVRYWEILNEGYDCVFGSRFMKGGGVIDYPKFKLYMNRMANQFIRILFRHGLNDTTNAFKAYRRTVIDGCRPIISPHFNITVELPLKAMVRGYSWTKIPITWKNRRHGEAKLKLKEMGSRYLFICLYIWLEKYFSRGDYKKQETKLMSAHSPEDLQRIYRERFEESQHYRAQVWKVIIKNYMNRFIPDDAVILDLGCGYGEFINEVNCREKLGMDLNPDCSNYLNKDVKFLRQDCSARWEVEDDSLDLVFTSNFFEHLPDKECLGRTLDEAYRCLRPGGRLIAMGPNIRYLPGRYWDYWDHYLPLTDQSLAEALTNRGYRIYAKHGKFLPYTMEGKKPAPLMFVQAYLAIPLAWQLLGRQFLVVAEK